MLRGSPSTKDADLVEVPGGEFIMGSDHHYPEERPARPVAIDGFRIERTPVTNRQFAAFVRRTGYVTVAERRPSAEDYPDAAPDLLQPGSSVFTPPPYAVDLRAPAQWWAFRPGASWRRPHGHGSSIRGLDDHPVVHVAYEDACAYAGWKGRVLPTEAQWEYAARGGLNGVEFAWGDDLHPEGRVMANTWRGEFPHLNLAAAGSTRTAPVTTYPPNGYGLFDMIGNVWEWTADFFGPHPTERSCCVPRNPRNDAPEARAIPRRVVKGGSHLCAPNYCRRYRPPARQPQEVDTATTHVGFRCVAAA